MHGWSTHEGQAITLPLDNIDTDQLIPARFMSRTRAEGYGPVLLHDLRRAEDGSLLPEFPLNRHSEASVLVAGRNFGSGSSREAAVYALVDADIRVVVAPSFGDIFASNAVNNGLLPAKLPEAEVQALMDRLGQDPAAAKIALKSCEIRIKDITARFSLPEAWRTKLINGWDDIDLTQQHAKAIAAYAQERRTTAPWAWPGGHL